MASGPGKDQDDPVHVQESKSDPNAAFTTGAPRAAPSEVASPPPPCGVEQPGEGRIPGIEGSGSAAAAVDRERPEGQKVAVLSPLSSPHGSTRSTSSVDAAEAEESAKASSPPPSLAPPFERVDVQPGEGRSLGAERKGKKAAVPSPAFCSPGSSGSLFSISSADAEAVEQLVPATPETDVLGTRWAAADEKQVICNDETFLNQFTGHCNIQLAEGISENGYDADFFNNKHKLGNKVIWPQAKEDTFLNQFTGHCKNKVIWPQAKEETFLNDSTGHSNKLAEGISENGYDAGVFNKRKLGSKIPLMEFADEYKNNDTFMQKFMLLHEKYCFLRRTAGDGSCFYRSFIFSYLEKAVAIPDIDVRRKEAIRLRDCIESGMQSCLHGLHRMPDAQFQRAFSGSEFVMELIEDGLAAGEFYERELTDNITSRILPLLRSLAEIELSTRESDYRWFLTEHASIYEYCVDRVRPDNGEACELSVMALINALGIAAVLGCVDMTDGGVEMPYSPRAGNVSPVVATLLYMPGHYNVLYAS